MAGSVSSSSPATGNPTRSRWGFILIFAWAALSAWITFELLRGETFRDDGVALPALMLLITTAVLGSRLYVFLQDRSARARHPDAPPPLRSAS